MCFIRATGRKRVVDTVVDEYGRDHIISPGIQQQLIWIAKGNFHNRFIINYNDGRQMWAERFSRSYSGKQSSERWWIKREMYLNLTKWTKVMW